MHGSSILAPLGADLSRYADWLAFLRELPIRVVVVTGSALPGPDLAVRTRAAFAWQDEFRAQLT